MTFSNDVEFICDNQNTNVYAVEIEADNLKVTILPNKKVHLYKMFGCDEFIIGLVVENNILLVKTCQDLSEDIQKNNIYLIDIQSNRIMLCNDRILNNSYHMPYITVYNDEAYIIAESAVIYPYEICEARRNTILTYTNDILMINLKKFITAQSKKEDYIWNTIQSPKDNHFIQILNVNGSYIWFFETDMKEKHTNIVKYNLLNNLSELNIYVEDRIDKAVFNNDILECMYKWNDTKQMIYIYNNEGNTIVNIDYSKLTEENVDIELNEIISISDNKYVIFNATDYSNDEEYQGIVIYDIKSNEFLTYNNSYISYDNLPV